MLHMYHTYVSRKLNSITRYALLPVNKTFFWMCWRIPGQKEKQSICVSWIIHVHYTNGSRKLKSSYKRDISFAGLLYIDISFAGLLYLLQVSFIFCRSLLSFAGLLYLLQVSFIFCMSLLSFAGLLYLLQVSFIGWHIFRPTFVCVD